MRQALLHPILFLRQNRRKQRGFGREPDSSGKLTMEEQMHIIFCKATESTSFINFVSEGAHTLSCSNGSSYESRDESFNDWRDVFTVLDTFKDAHRFMSDTSGALVRELKPGQIAKVTEGVFCRAIPVVGGFPNDSIIFI